MNHSFETKLEIVKKHFGYSYQRELQKRKLKIDFDKLPKEKIEELYREMTKLGTTEFYLKTH